MNAPFNKLSNAQAERLYILLEELGEAQQAIGKILRHGYESGWNGSNNRIDLEKELGHVQYAIKRLNAKDLNEIRVIDALFTKALGITPFLHHQDDED